MRPSTLLTCATVLLAGGAPAWGHPKTAAAAPSVAITGIEARLFYEGTGVLSDNIAPPATFHGWNSMIGEGAAKQPANDLVVSVALSSDPPEASATTPLTVAVINEKGRTIAKRKFRSLYFKTGKAVKALFVPDAACIGKVTIKATLGGQTRITNVELGCGE